MWSTAVSPASAALLAGGLELDIPDAAKLALGIDEINQAAAEPAHRRNFEFAGPDRLTERPVEQLFGTRQGRRRIIDLQTDGANRGPVGDMERVGEPLGFGIDHDVDSALRPAGDGLRFVQARAREAEPAQQRLEGRRIVLAHGEFDECGAAALRPRRQQDDVRVGLPGAPAQLVKQEQERALAVHRHAAG